MSLLLAPHEVIPHKGDAVLLDEILNYGEHSLQARLVVRPGTVFSDPAGHLPAWAGPEIMAQAISALSGHRSVDRNGTPATIGLLLGIRRYETSAAEFRCGDELHVEVIESYEDEDGRAVFDCRIRRDGAQVAAGTLTVFQPADLSSLDAVYAQ